MRLSNFIDEDNILCAASAGSMEEARLRLLELYAKNTGKAYEPVLEALHARDKLGSTVIAPGIAIPHIRESFLEDFYVLLGLFPQGVHTPESPAPVKLICLFLVPSGKSNLYLRVLAAFSRFLASSAGADVLADVKTPEDFRKIVRENDQQVGEVATAADIMQTDHVILPDTATLREAADMMVTHRVTDIPVVNAAGEFLGLVTTGRLLKVGIPDYLLMMDNLNFLKSFEPFQDLLKQEQTMKVTEVMKTEVPKFTPSTPMIQVAGKLVESHVEFGVILEGKKFIGTISRFDFIHKVVRV